MFRCLFPFKIKGDFFTNQGLVIVYYLAVWLFIKLLRSIWLLLSVQVYLLLSIQILLIVQCFLVVGLGRSVVVLARLKQLRSLLN